MYIHKDSYEQRETGTMQEMNKMNKPHQQYRTCWAVVSWGKCRQTKLCSQWNNFSKQSMESQTI